MAAKDLSSRVLNLVLRGISLLSKLVVLVFLTKYLTPEEVGVYGLFAATVVYFVSFIGLEFHVYSTREAVSAFDEKLNFIFFNSLFFYLFLYIVSLPIILLIFYFEFLEWKYLVFFIIILVLEHSAAELSRLYIVKSKNILASLLLFFRTSLWGLALIPLLTYFPEYRSLDVVFYFWIIGGGVGFIIGFVKLRSIGILYSEFSSSILSRGWVLNGFKKCLYFFISSQFLVLMYVIDKYYITFLSGLESVSPYVLFLGISNSLVSFLEASVFVFLYPRLIHLYGQGSRVEFFTVRNRMMVQSILLMFLILVFFFFFIDYILIWVNRETYLESKGVFYVLMFSSCFKVLGMIPHYLLYASKHDKHIVVSNFLTFLLFVICLFAFLRSSYSSLEIVSFSFLLTFFFQFLMKTTMWYRVRNKLVWGGL